LRKQISQRKWRDAQHPKKILGDFSKSREKEKKPKPDKMSGVVVWQTIC
jgi:hypothetical protein